jgi:hypothetical protein
MYAEISLNLGLIFLILIFIIQRAFHIRRDIAIWRRGGERAKAKNRRHCYKAGCLSFRL